MYRKIIRFKNIFCRWKSLKSHKGILYTHRWESGNDTFQNMPHMFSGLDNAFARPGWTWRHKKWKDQTFLHRNYIPKIFSTLTKNIFLLDQKNFRKKIRKFLVRKIFARKSIFFLKLLKFQHFEILIFFFDFAGKFFTDQKSLIFFRNIFWSSKKIFFVGVEKLLGIKFRCKNVWSFHFLCFQARQTRFLAR